jgi:hypothetical protein
MRAMLSVVVCSTDPKKQRVIRAEYERAVGRPYEFILIDDARSLAEGYNRGVAQSCGDVIVLSHDDIEIHSTELAGRLYVSLQKLDLVGVAGTSRLADAQWTAAGRPYLHGNIKYAAPSGERWQATYGPPSDKIEALDGVFLAARRAVCITIPFDEGTFDGFHLYDLDFSHRAFLGGFRVGICDLDLTHHSQGTYDKTWKRYAASFVMKHRSSLRPNLFRTGDPQWAIVRI